MKEKITKAPFVKKDSEVKAWLMSGLFGVLSGLFLVLGYQLEKNDHIDLRDQNAMLVMLLIMVVFTVDAKNIWKGYERSKTGARFLGFFDLTGFFQKGNAKDTVDKNEKKDFLINFGILILLYLPVLLAEYPGFFVYDAQDELNEVLTRTFTTHHPLIHVLLLGGTIALFHKISGSWNLGIFMYLLFQMLVIAAVFAYVIGFMKKRGFGTGCRILCILYYGLFPPIVMFTLCSSKDGLFSALLILVTVFLFQLTGDTKTFLADKRKVLLFIASATLMPCFRHNGFYAYLVFVPFAIWYFRKKLNKVFVTCLISPVILYLIISNALSLALTDGDTHHQEMLTVPIMQLSRTYKYHRDEFTEDEVRILTSYIPSENLDLYTDRVSDLVKVGFDNTRYRGNSVDFWKLWYAKLKEYPMTYVNAMLLTSYGYVYPAAKINVYKGTTVYTFTYEDSSYFGYEVELPGERKSLFKPIDDLYRYLSIGTFFEDHPIPGLLFAPGMLAIIYLFVFCYRLAYGHYRTILPFMPIFLTFCTILLGPTYLVRYVIYLWFAFPLLFVVQ